MTKRQTGPGRIRPIYARKRITAIAARWDARADSWDQSLEDPSCHLNEDDSYCRFTRFVQRLIAQRPRFCAAHGILDAGCGTGLVMTDVVSAFAWGKGVDISPKMVRAARAKHLAKTKFLLGDCFDLPALCPKAGMVVSRGVLLSHYGRKQGQAILSAARFALVPGGFAVFDFLNEAARAKYRHVPENKTLYTGKEIQLMALGAGFRMVSIVGQSNRRVLLLLAET